ncbi:BZ3500_MvSof-1268-A1-R1_Chr1-3g02152 [Microbotryum saponariae]|uniref:BZ3500_MvSof-1268-A1-R1_Chr1-3g02152 protein n=1 Tax=Microbotryum saponariae TaxID=289078 RepID=A0A2X0KRH7_9BASI|nr:BZ3500_MvSof-1268-A1-R1_Chr1-3g02152 [Microbotryum saponariae]SCZ95517.1 BZ3501_MvSof-1269-A2-R1_Chr1-3g01755 [Microbotryum saponariae]
MLTNQVSGVGFVRRDDDGALRGYVENLSRYGELAMTAEVRHPFSHAVGLPVGASLLENGGTDLGRAPDTVPVVSESEDAGLQGGTSHDIIEEDHEVDASGLEDGEEVGMCC